MQYVCGRCEALLGRTVFEQLYLADADGAKPHLAACGVAAAWRLGQWELLDEYLARTHTSGHLLDAGEQWEVRLGELLSGLHRRHAPQ